MKSIQVHDTSMSCATALKLAEAGKRVQLAASKLQIAPTSNDAR